MMQMMEILFLALLIAPIEEAPPIRVEIEQKVRLATRGESRPLGYSKEDLSPFSFPCTLPDFHGWIVVDLSGNDQYREGPKNDYLWITNGHFKGMKGFGLDDGPDEQ